MRRSATIPLAIAVLGLSGCGGGGTLTKKDMQKQAGAVQSLAAEGDLLARGAAEGRTTDTFVRVHSQYLEEAGRKLKTELASVHASGALDKKRGAAVTLVSRISDEIAQLHAAPGDRALARRLEQQFGERAKAAMELAK